MSKMYSSCIDTVRDNVNETMFLSHENFTTLIAFVH